MIRTLQPRLPDFVVLLSHIPKTGGTSRINAFSEPLGWVYSNKEVVTFADTQGNPCAMSTLMGRAGHCRARRVAPPCSQSRLSDHSHGRILEWSG